MHQPSLVNRRRATAGRLAESRHPTARRPTTRQSGAILPSLAPFYHQFAQPVGWLIFRVIIGGLLMVEGWPKIITPVAQAGFVEGIGLYPGWFFSALLAVMQFIGGFLIVIGLLTRPIALVNAAMLAVTIWFHITRPYGDAFLTPKGIEFLQSNLQYLTQQGQARLLGSSALGNYYGAPRNARLTLRGRF